MTGLLDVGVLVALAWPNHVHHEAVHRWFRTQQKNGWATCPVTESGFVRVSSNRRVVPEARSPRECIELLRQLTAMPHHLFWSDDISIARSPHVSADRLVGYRQVTDAHLLALALRRHGQLVTLDSGIQELLPPEGRAESVVIVR